MRLLREALRRLIKPQLKLNIENSKFLENEVTYLGHITSKNGIKAEPRQIECMQNFPKPTSLTEVQRFLGMCNYYRIYVQDFAKKKTTPQLVQKRYSVYLDWKLWKCFQHNEEIADNIASFNFSVIRRNVHLDLRRVRLRGWCCFPKAKFQMTNQFNISDLGSRSK